MSDVPTTQRGLELLCFWLKSQIKSVLSFLAYHHPAGAAQACKSNLQEEAAAGASQAQEH